MPEILEAEQARGLIEERALDRPIAAVHAPDAWFLKRGLTPPAIRRVLRDRAFVSARRRGKLMLIDTSDDGPVVGLHLGMTGRIVIDGEAAGGPLQYSSNRDVHAWRRFGVQFADGGTLCLRDPRRLGAVELDPDEHRLGPDALSLTRADLAGVLTGRRAPVKAVLMDQRRVAGLGNLLTDEVLWRAGIDPAREAGMLEPDEVATLHRAIRTTLRVLGRRGGSHTGDHMPARFAGAPCPKDGAPLLRRTIGGRTTFSCPQHQS
ncbi:MAG: formamidopyrimidine-DNA glycosylase [Acidimicrobiia bacterium]